MDVVVTDIAGKPLQHTRQFVEPSLPCKGGLHVNPSPSIVPNTRLRIGVAHRTATTPHCPPMPKPSAGLSERFFEPDEGAHEERLPLRAPRSFGAPSVAQAGALSIEGKPVMDHEHIERGYHEEDQRIFVPGDNDKPPPARRGAVFLKPSRSRYRRCLSCPNCPRNHDARHVCHRQCRYGSEIEQDR